MNEILIFSLASRIDCSCLVTKLSTSKRLQTKDNLFAVSDSSQLVTQIT